jgi:hypothetical protein
VNTSKPPLPPQCLILGAGFSRAVSDQMPTTQMPTTDELGDLATAALRDGGHLRRPEHFQNGYFEAWLSRLAEPQPDLRDDENLHNEAWFVRLTEILRDVLVGRQEEVMSAGPPPWWLQRLIGVAHQLRMSVITFNYDTLIESAFDTATVWDWKQSRRAFTSHLLSELPPSVLQPDSYGFPPAETFRLIKLHGSVDCWWVRGDATGATIIRAHPLAEPWTAERPQRDAPPGRTPFVVPPAAAKSSFYRNPVTRELWQRAAEALGNADRVALVGYSVPVTDLVTSGMLADRLTGRTVTVDVVNPCPRPPVKALARIGIDAQAYPGSVESYVDKLEDEACQAARKELEALPANLPVLVGTDPKGLAAVTGTTPTEQGTSLKVEPFGDSHGATRPRNREDAPPLTVTDLRNALRADGRLYVQHDDAHTSCVIGWQRLHTETGMAPEWAVGVISAGPPQPGSSHLTGQPGGDG